MRKTRLVILPTKCLHQMGFLLLFLSCPVIGDWGRIRPESENSQNAIQIDREGICGLERDPPGGLLGFLNETGFKQCRLTEDSDLNQHVEKPVSEQSISFRRSNERRVHVRRISQRESERRMAYERRDAKREIQRGVRRDVRSRSVEPRRSNYRNDFRVRSLSLSRLENERTVGKQRTFRQYGEGSRTIEAQRLHLNRRSERRGEQERRLSRESSNERRENGIAVRTATERRGRETRRLARSVERERQDIRRDNNRRSFTGFSTRRENDIRSQSRERTENIRERNERRLSLVRRELQDANKAERTENRRINLERRLPEIRRARSLEMITREKSVRITRNPESSRDAEIRRFVSLSPKLPERNIREYIRSNGLLNERMENKARRMNSAAVRQNRHDIRDLKLENKKAEEEKPFEEVSEWMNFKSYEGFKTGDWTTNCVIGAVVYFLTTRQIKTV